MDDEDESEVEESMLAALASLFERLQAQKKRTGIFGPKAFVQTLRHKNRTNPQRLSCCNC